MTPDETRVRRRWRAEVGAHVKVVWMRVAPELMMNADTLAGTVTRGGRRSRRSEC